MRRRQSSERGFTLLETLIAFAILSAALVLTYQIFTDGFRARARVAMTLECEIRASQDLSRIRVEAHTLGQVQSGTRIDEDGYQRTVASGALVERSVGLNKLSEVRVTVHAPDDRSSVTLTSIVTLSGGDEG